MINQVGEVPGGAVPAQAGGPRRPQMWRHSLRLSGHSPLQLLLVLLLPGLGLHLLHLDGVGLPAAHVQLVVPHAELQDPLVDSQARGVEHKVLQSRTGRLGGHQLLQ